MPGLLGLIAGISPGPGGGGVSRPVETFNDPISGVRFSSEFAMELLSLEGSVPLSESRVKGGRFSGGTSPSRIGLGIKGSGDGGTTAMGGTMIGEGGTGLGRSSGGGGGFSK